MSERDVFEAAVDLPVSERDLFLVGVCDGDQSLRLRMDALLRKHDQARSFLEQPVLAEAVAAKSINHLDRPAVQVGQVIDERYTLLEEIGEGGMGTVWMAQQTGPVRRQVALKLIKPGMDSRAVLARFEAERQALALMDHLNIAKIFDGGVTLDGRPFFVMELVKGVPITTYCDEHHLTPRQRLELFVPVCQAIQHAHQKGIIHRDLKPSNILVGMNDPGTPGVPKVIDFGVAKATGQSLTDKTLLTGFGNIVGTLEYMSPEQAEVNQVDIDTRSDIYSLGVVLYELLAGSPPFSHTETAGLLETLRVIREEEPSKPSMKLSTAVGLPALAANRGTEPAKLTKLMRGELDWITLRALEKDRERRYQTANDFAADIQRYLADEPVRACPPSVAYRLRKFVRRNRGTVATAGLMAIALVVGVVGLAISNFRIAREQEEKEAALKDAEANLALAREAVEKMYQKVAAEVSVLPYMQPYQREVLQNALVFYEEFARRNRDHPGIRFETAVAALRVAQIRYSLGARKQGEQEGAEAVATLQRLAAESPTPRCRSDLAAGYAFLGGVHNSAGRFHLGEFNYRQSLELIGELIREFPNATEYKSRMAAYFGGLALVQDNSPMEAEANYLEAIRLYDTLVVSQSDALKYQGDLAQVHYRLAASFERTGRTLQAEAAFRQSIVTFEKQREPLLHGSYREILPNAKSKLGKLLAAAGKKEEAELLWRDAIVLWERHCARFPDVPRYPFALLPTYFDLAKFLEKDGRKEESAAIGRSATVLSEKLLAETYAETDVAARCADLADLGIRLRDLGELKSAEKVLRKSLKLAEALAVTADASDRGRLAIIHYDLANVLQRARRPREAAEGYRQSLTIYEQLAKEFPADPDYRLSQATMANYLGIVLRGLPGETAAALQHHETAVLLCDQLVADFPDQSRYRAQLSRSHYSVGNAQAVAGRCAEAEAAFRKTLAISDQWIDTNKRHGYPAHVPSVQNDLAWLLATCPDEKRRNPNEAVQLATKAVEGDPRPSYWNTLGVAHYRAGNFKEALAALDKSMALSKSGDGDGFDWFFVAMAHGRLDHKDDADRWYSKAVDWMEKNQPKNQELRRFRTEAEELLGKDTQKSDTKEQKETSGR